MKLLVDTCVAESARNDLVYAGHDVLYAADWDADPGDEQILARAFVEERVLITIDKDFGELAVRRGLPHHGIIRLVNLRAKQQGELCVAVLKQYADELSRAAIITAQVDHVRVRDSS